MRALPLVGDLEARLTFCIWSPFQLLLRRCYGHNPSPTTTLIGFELSFMIFNDRTL